MAVRRHNPEDLMKLAEALQERNSLNIKLGELRDRMIRNAIVQEGEEPSENPIDLCSEYDLCAERLEYLINRINLTNCTTRTEDGRTLTELLAARDCLKEKLSSYRCVIAEASSITRRATRTEIKILSTISVNDFQKKVDDMSKQLRIVENMIQQTNWTVDLTE